MSKRSFLMFVWDEVNVCVSIVLCPRVYMHKEKIKHENITICVFITFCIRFLPVDDSHSLWTLTHIYALGICADVAKQFSEMDGKRGTHYFAQAYTVIDDDDDNNNEIWDEQMEHFIESPLSCIRIT